MPPMPTCFRQDKDLSHSFLQGVCLPCSSCSSPELIFFSPDLWHSYQALLSRSETEGRRSCCET